MLTGAVTKQITSDQKKELLLTRWYGLATDGSSDEDEILKSKDSRMIVTSFLDMPNVNSGSTAQRMYDVCNEVREGFSLCWDNCVTYSSDNTNSMIGQGSSLLQNIQSTQGDQKIFHISWLSHLAHMCTGNEAKELSVNVEDFLIDI